MATDRRYLMFPEGRLEHLLRHNGMTDEAFAMRIGVDARTVRNWLRGDNRPLKSRLRQFLDVFKFQTDLELYGGAVAQDSHVDAPYMSLQERLLSCGVSIHDDLRNAALERLGAKFAIDDVIVDADFAGYRGVASNQFVVQPASVGRPCLPDYVYEARGKIPSPRLNKRKAYLESWSAPIIDQGNIVTLQIGHFDERVPGGRYDYWTTLAVLNRLPILHQELLDGTLRLRELARRLDLVVVVVTADERLVLARRSNQVDNAQGQWMASVGESLDPSVDTNANGVSDPLIATRRCLGEHDELNLSASDVSGSRLRILGLATEWQYLYVNLIVLVELNVEYERVKDRASEGEHTHFDSLEFSTEACLPLVKYGRHEGTLSGQSGALVPASRVALLMSLINRFGYDEIVGRIG
jgi:transcriptional regulator with XRE-family HTH domain